MRRNDREITDPAITEAFLAKEQIIRIAFYDHGELYIVPVNYGFQKENGQYRFYFHGAKAGRKYTLSLANPEIGFEIDGAYVLHTEETACGHSAGFMSVMQCLMQQTTGKSDWVFDEAAMQKTAVFRIDVQTFSCKAKG